MIIDLRSFKHPLLDQTLPFFTHHHACQQDRSGSASLWATLRVFLDILRESVASAKVYFSIGQSQAHPNWQNVQITP